MDALFNDRDKCQQFEEGIFRFVNAHLGPMNRTVTDVTSSFTDGVNLILLCGTLGNFYIPVNSYSIKPLSRSEMETNIRYAFEILRDLGVNTTFFDVTDILNGNKKAILKLLYSIFKRYK
uniref:Alpha-parvin (Trinotate prediction) n=1 Tax=Henneguya salminicola TaxID=69463 RepID=A0A6G3MJB1_HENSL